MSVVVEDNTERMTVKAYKSKSAYTLPMLLCITDGNECSTSSGASSAPFVNVPPLDDGDIAPYLKDGFSDIYITTTISDWEIKINFSNMKESNYNVTIAGYSSDINRQSIFAPIPSSKVQNLTLINCKLSSGIEFDYPIVNLVQITFNITETYKFGENVKLITDALSIDSIFKLNNPPIMNEIFFKPDYTQFFYRYDYTEEITIDSDIYKICMRGDESYSKKLAESHESLLGVESCGWDCRRVCSNRIDSKYFKKLTYLSEHGGTFTINSMSTKVKPIKIIVDPRNPDKYSWSMKGSGWSTKLTDKFVIDNGDHFFKIQISNPGIVENLDIIGSASVLYEVEYAKDQKYCVYDENATNTCKVSSSEFQVVSNEFDNFVDRISETSVAISFDYSANIVEIPKSLFNKKKVTINSTPSSSNIASEITIGFDNTKLDSIYSLTIFDDIRTVYNKDVSATAYFGQFKVNGNWTVDDNWKQHVNVEASQMSCKFQHLEQFKSITITDQLTLTGDLVTEGEEVIVNFTPDGDANDLIAEIKGDVTITIDDNFLKIGKYKFMITHSENYDAYFQVKDDASITINSVVADKNNFVKDRKSVV